MFSAGAFFTVARYVRISSQLRQHGFGVGAVALEIVEAVLLRFPLAPALGFDDGDAERHAFANVEAREQVESREAHAVGEHFVAGRGAFDGSDDVRQQLDEVLVVEILEVCAAVPRAMLSSCCRSDCRAG